MHRLTLFAIFWSLAISIGRSQETPEPKETSQTATPAIQQPSPYRPAEPVLRTADSKCIVIQLGVDAQESEAAMEFIADLEAAGIAKMSAAKLTPVSGSPILVEVFMRGDASREKIKQLIVALSDSGVEQMVLEFGGIHPEGKEQHNALFFRATQGYSRDELQRLEKVAQEAAERCGLSLYFAGTIIAPAEQAFVGPGDQEAVTRDAASYAPVPRPPQPATKTVKVFALRHAQATDAAEVLKQVYDKDPSKIVPDARTNSLIVTGLEAQVLEIEALLLKLDQVGKAKPGKQDVGNNGNSTEQIIDSVSELQKQAAQLRSDYEAANKQAHDLAESLRETPDAAKKAQLRTAVQRAFTLRQSLLRAELLEMQTRLLQTQQSLDMRERIAHQIVDRRVEDLVNPQLEWEQGLDGERKTPSELKPPGQPESSVADDSGVVTELEGDWHRVAYIDKWQTERRPINMTIRANQETATLWTGESVSRAILVDENARTVDVAVVELKGGLPNQIVSERGTYALAGDVLTIHSEYTITDSLSGALVQQGQHTNIWKRGLCKIEDYDSRNPGNGLVFFYLNGNNEDTGHGKLIPGDKVDVLVSLNLPNGTPNQLVLAENLEVDGSSKPKENSQGQMRLQGTSEQCSLLQNMAKHRTMSLRTRNLNDETLQFPDGINREAFKELDAAAPEQRLDVPVTELEGDWHLVSITDKAGNPVEVSPVNLSFRNDRYTLAYQGGQNDRRVEVYPDQNEIRYFADGDDSFTRTRYLLNGDELTIDNESQKRVHHRGHVRIPKSIPKATDEQKTHWRSGIVDIIAQQANAAVGDEKRIGYGVIVSPQMLIVAQLKLSDGDWSFSAKFDDGGMVPIKIVEEGPQGWVTFQPERSIEVNHHFQLSTAAVGQYDEVHFWGTLGKLSDQHTSELLTTTVTTLDRKSPAVGKTVWQLRYHDRLEGSLPILDANGDLLAIALIGTGDLFLAVPVSQLKTMLPKSLVQLAAAETSAELSTSPDSEAPNSLKEN